MLSIRCRCECGEDWESRMPDEEVLALEFNDANLHTISRQCPSCNRPVTVEIKANDQRTDYHCVAAGGQGDVTLNRHEVISIFSDDDLQDYLTNVVARRPDRIFQQAIDELHETFGGDYSKVKPGTFARMVFNQLFAVLEAYLGDRLIRVIEEDDDALKAMIIGDTQFAKMNLRFADAFDAVEIVRKRVLKELAEKTTYHKFEDIDPYYIAVFGMSLFEMPQARQTLKHYKQLRNDCVHRNGYTTDGNKVEITSIEVAVLSTVVYNLFAKIEQAYSQRYMMQGA